MTFSAVDCERVYSYPLCRTSLSGEFICSLDKLQLNTQQWAERLTGQCAGDSERTLFFILQICKEYWKTGVRIECTRISET